MAYDAKKVAGQRLDMTGDGSCRSCGSFVDAPLANRIHSKDCPFASNLNVVLFRDIDGKFATTTNGAIVKKSNGEVLPDDEPLFLFRARDYNALKILVLYQEICATEEGADWQVNKMEDIIQKFADFAKEHPERMKQPGIAKGK